jgi:hypothetical protein
LSVLLAGHEDQREECHNCQQIPHTMYLQYIR